MQQNNFPPEVRRALQRGRTDIVFFAWYFLGLTLHPGQIRFLREADGLINVLVPGNRFGKTVIIAVRHIWHNFYKVGLSEGDGTAWTKAGYQTAALGPDSEVLEVDFRIIKQIMSSSFVISREGEPIKTNFCRISWWLMPEACRNTAPFYIQFRDNSSIRFFSGSEGKFGNVQGKKFGYGSYDEGGRSYHLEYELKSNLIPRFQEMAAPLDIPSTPDQRSPSIGYHYDIFEKGLRREEGFRSFSGNAFENIYLPQAYFDGVELAYGNDPLKRQVLYGEFVFAGDTLFPKEDINKCRRKELDNGERFESGHKYIVASDTSIGGDEQVHIVLDVPEEISTKTPMRLARVVGWRGSSKQPQIAVQDFTDLFDAYDKERSCYHILETWNGEAVQFFYHLPEHIRRKTTCYGSFHGPSGKKSPRQHGTQIALKPNILAALRRVMARQELLIPDADKELIKQLEVYRMDDDKLRQDRVIALALGVWMATDGQPSNPIARAHAISW